MISVLLSEINHQHAVTPGSFSKKLIHRLSLKLRTRSETISPNEQSRNTEDSDTEIIDPYFWHAISVDYSYIVASQKYRDSTFNLNARIFSVPALFPYFSSTS